MMMWQPIWGYLRQNRLIKVYPEVDYYDYDYDDDDELNGARTSLKRWLWSKKRNSFKEPEHSVPKASYWTKTWVSWITSCFSNIHYDIILPSITRSHMWPLYILISPNRCIGKRIKIFWTWIFQISLAASTFIMHLKQLQASTLERMSTLPFRECAREQYLRHLWHHNEQVKAEISALSANIEEQNNDIKLKLMAKTLLIKQHEAKIERLNRKCEEDIKKRV